MKKSMGAAGVVFALAAGGAMADETAPVCDSATEQPMTIVQLTEPVPAGQAVAFLLELDKESPMWEELRTADNEELGAILNETLAEGLSFDPDSAFRLNRQEVFEKFPHIVVHVCQDEGTMNVIEVVEALKEIEGILYAAPDSTLEPVPVIIEPPKRDI